MQVFGRIDEDQGGLYFPMILCSAFFLKFATIHYAFSAYQIHDLTLSYEPTWSTGSWLKRSIYEMDFNLITDVFSLLCSRSFRIGTDLVHMTIVFMIIGRY